MVPAKKPVAQFGIAYKNVVHWQVFSMKLVFQDNLIRNENKLRIGRVSPCPGSCSNFPVFQPLWFKKIKSKRAWGSIKTL